MDGYPGATAESKNGDAAIARVHGATPTLLLIITLVFFEFETFAYLLINSISSSLPSKNLMTRADAHVTLRVRSLWLYLSFVPYCLMSALRFETLRRMLRIVCCIVINSLVAYRSFLRWPSAYPRPTLPALEPGTPLERSWRTLHAVDRPSNTFPSIHVSHSFLLALILARHAPRERGEPLLFWALGISLSTVLTKQHYLVDVTAGVIVAEEIMKHVYEPWDQGTLRLSDAFRGIRALCTTLDALASAPERYRLPAQERHPRINALLRSCYTSPSFAEAYLRLEGREQLFADKASLLEFLGRLRRSLAVANSVMPGWLQFVRDFQAADPYLSDQRIHAYLQELDGELGRLLHLLFEAPRDSVMGEQRSRDQYAQVPVDH